MLPLGTSRFVDLRIYNGASPVNGLTLANLTIYFTRNGHPCTDLIGLLPNGPGRYMVAYTPSAVGHDYVEVTYAPTGYVLMSSEDIVDLGAAFSNNNAVTITQNYGGTGALVPHVPNPASYTLYIFKSSDWVSGNTDTSQAFSSTALAANGNWIDTSLVLLHDTYHFILRNSAGEVIVFKANLVI